MSVSARVRALLAAALFIPVALIAQQSQPIDSAYTARIRELLQDPRISTELVDHLPASATVPSPLKFFGRIPGTVGELTYAADIHRYYFALDSASPRIKAWKIGVTEEGRDMIVLVASDSATIANLDTYKGYLKELTDPRRTSEARAQELLRTAKPIYWVTSGLHSGETGGPEMLMEMAYRLAVSEMPLIQNIRNNSIVFITPVLEVDGRERQVDTYYFNKKRPTGEARLPLMYWGKYVAHDNNRDGMGQFLSLTRNTNRLFLEWTPQVMHDLHESVSYLYTSTGTGPYNEWLDPITVTEWWTMAQVDVMEMTKRGVPGVWTYGFYDGWTPNYLFFAAHAHNAIGRFYEVQSYGPDLNPTLRVPAQTTSREWFRPNPPLPEIAWGPRNSVNIGQSALLFSLDHFATNRKLYLENYWLKNKRAMMRGRTAAPYAWVVPAGQRRRVDAVDAINELQRQGLEIHIADAPFTAGTQRVERGDYIIRADQPYRTLADMYFAVQNFSPANPRPYDDTGWTFQFMRNVVVQPIADSAVLTRNMTRLTEPARSTGGISGTGRTIIVDHTTDNALVTMRFRLHDVAMKAAEADFTVGNRSFRAGSFIIENADAAKVGAVLTELGINGVAVATAPTVASHDLDVPRIGYVHAWQNTQNEGWVRAALDTYGVPYTYFADQKLREGNLRAKYDVIIFPHVGGSAQAQVNGIAMTGTMPLPYQRTGETPNLGANDTSDDIRGGMGFEGLLELYNFVKAGGTLIVEGATTTIFPEYNLTTGITIESPAGLFARGSVMRGIVSDRTSPIAYGYNAQVPVYFNQAPVLSVSALGGGGFGGGGGGAGASTTQQNTTPMATRVTLSPWDWNAVEGTAAATAAANAPAAAGRGARGANAPATPAASTATPARTGAATPAAPAGNQPAARPANDRPRVILSFPTNANDILLSGTLDNGAALAGRAQVVDAPIGQGHVVMFAIRPFWRWQTHGTFFLGFNAILHWNDLSAGR
jgi:hypothetical protein